MELVNSFAPVIEDMKFIALTAITCKIIKIWRGDNRTPWLCHVFVIVKMSLSQQFCEYVGESILLPNSRWWWINYVEYVICFGLIKVEYE